MIEFVKAGGVLIWPILACSVVAVAIIVERFLSLKRSAVTPPNLLDQTYRLAGRADLSGEVIFEVQRRSPLGKILAAGLINRNEPRFVMKDAIEDAGRHVVHDLERYLNTLGTIAAVTPLLGLLGTVFGMIKVFAAITAFGVGNPTVLAGGIAEALITTAAGLSVGIPTLMFHRYFRGRINDLTMDMEQQALRFIDMVDGRIQHSEVQGTN